MKDVHESTSPIMELVCTQAREAFQRGESADEFKELARVGSTVIYLAASQDHESSRGPELYANPADCFLHMISGEAEIRFPDAKAQFMISPGGAIKIPSHEQHSAAFRRLSLYLSVVHEPESAVRILGSGLDSSGCSFAICHYPTPSAAIRDTISNLAAHLTPKWFTERVPSDARRDLLFQHAIVYWEAGRPVGFLTFTSIDSAVHVTLMGTEPTRHRRELERA